MVRSIARPLAVAAVAALAGGALGAGPAVAGGDHGGTSGYDVAVPLTERTTDELLDGRNNVTATGKAVKSVKGDRIVLGFPVAGGDRHRTKSGSLALRGGVTFVGAGPDVSWTKLRLNPEHGVVSAILSGGKRATILKYAGHRDGRHRSGHGSSKLVLTTAGAKSLNRAAQGAPFDAGDVFAAGRDCGR